MAWDCDVCATFERQLKRLEAEIENLIDRREAAANLLQEHPTASEQSVNDALAAFHQTQSLYDHHKLTAHGVTEKPAC